MSFFSLLARFQVILTFVTSQICRKMSPQTNMLSLTPLFYLNFSGHYGISMGYGGASQQQMWNYGGYGGGYGSMEGYPPVHGMGMDQGWWQNNPNYRGIPQAPGSWALRGQRQRPDRRGPGRPRLSSAKMAGLPPGPGMAAGSDHSMTGPRPRLMSPVNQFPPPFGGPHLGGSMIPEGSPNDLMPPSPSSSGSGSGSASSKKRAAGRPRSVVSPTTAANALLEGNPGALGVGGGVAPEGKVTKGGSTNNNKKRYVCEVCQKRFSTAWYVRVHRKSHNGERPYICHNCGKGFMLPNVLQVHLRKCEKTNANAGNQRQPPRGAGAPIDGPTPPGGAGDGLGSPATDQHPFPEAPQQAQAGPAGFGVGLAGFPDQSSPAAMMSGSSSNIPSPNTYGSGIGYNNQRYMGPGGNSAGGGGTATSAGPTAPSGGGAMSPYNPSVNDQIYSDPYAMHHMQEMSHPHLPSPQFSPMYSPPPSTGLGSTVRTQPQPPPTAGGPGEMMPQNNSNLPGHFLANDRPLDKGGGAGRSVTSNELYCPPCDIQFGDMSGLEEHLKTHRPFTCDICEKRFSQKCNLVTHQRLHTGERPYACNHCEKRFTQKGNLDAHIKTHTKEKPYVCPSCGKRFSFKASMVSHAKQVHGIMELSEQELEDARLEFPPSPSFSPGIPTPQSSLDSTNGHSMDSPTRNPYDSYKNAAASTTLHPPPHHSEFNSDINISASSLSMPSSASPSPSPANGFVNVYNGNADTRSSLVMS